jgi:hypothetical protein
MKLVNLAEQAPYLRLLVYGMSGVGKTYLSGTSMLCEETCPALFLNAVGQPVTLRNFDPPPLVIDVERMKDFNEPYAWILKGQPLSKREVAGSEFLQACDNYLHKYGFLDSESPEQGTFKTLVVDGITHAQRVSLDGVTGSAATLPGDMPKQAQIQDWGGTLRQMINFVHKYYQLPIHVIVTALCKEVTLEGMGYPIYGPMLWGQSSHEIPAHAEIITRLVSLESLQTQKISVLKSSDPTGFEGAINIAQLRGGRNFIAKWQGVIDPPAYLLDPSIQKFIDVLNS